MKRLVPLSVVASALACFVLAGRAQAAPATGGVLGKLAAESHTVSQIEKAGWRRRSCYRRSWGGAGATSSRHSDTRFYVLAPLIAIARPARRDYFLWVLSCGLARRAGLDCQCVHRIFKLIAEQIVHHPVSFDARFSGKVLRHDQHTEMALARAG